MNKHSTDVESPPPPQRVCTSVHPGGEWCSDIVRALLVNDPGARARCSAATSPRSSTSTTWHGCQISRFSIARLRRFTSSLRVLVGPKEFSSDRDYTCGVTVIYQRGLSVTGGCIFYVVFKHVDLLSVYLLVFLGVHCERALDRRCLPTSRTRASV